MTASQVDKVKDKLPPNTEVILDQPDQFSFRDRYGITWQLVPPGQAFLMNGEAEGRWLEL